MRGSLSRWRLRSALRGPRAFVLWALLVLVVAAIVIACYGVWLYRRDKIRAETGATYMLLVETTVACETYADDRGLSVRDIPVDNSVVNAGAKALAQMVLSEPGYLRVDLLRDRGYLKEDTDGNQMLIDSWGNPVIFIPGAHYGSTFQYRNARGESFTVRARRHTSDHGYQLWSLGPNGVDDRGGGDDVVPRYEE